MKHLTTSHRITIKFTLFTLLVVFLFGLLMHVAFFIHWMHQEHRNLRPLEVGPQHSQGSRTHKQATLYYSQERLRQHFQQVMSLDRDDPITVELLEAKRILGITHFQDKRYIYKTTGSTVLVRDVSILVERQWGLIKLSLLLLILFGGLSYVFSRWFVLRALSDLHELASYVKKLDVDSLEEKIFFDHLPDNDEIQLVGRAVNQMATNIHYQIRSIKQFISYVSHEFKTPLMIMRTDAELALKSKHYKIGLEKNLTEIDTLSRLLDSLILLTHAQAGSNFERSRVSVRGVVMSAQQQVIENYDKYINFSCTGADVELLCHQGSLERIITNLLDNAYKYTPDGGTVQVILSEKSLSITDTGRGIRPEEHKHIREPFWQADKSKGIDRGFGLGLALVKVLVDLHKWKITVESEVGVGSTFVLKRT